MRADGSTCASRFAASALVPGSARSSRSRPTSCGTETLAQAATSCVAMMQPADHREGDYLPPIGGLALAEFGGVLVEREVGPGSVIVLEVLAQDAPEVPLSENDDVVEAVPPNGPE